MITEDQERRLRERVRDAYARRESEFRPGTFSRMLADAHASRRRSARGRVVWGRPALALAATAFAVVGLVSWLGGDEALELDALTQALVVTVTWRSPTDALLELGPQQEPISTLPSIYLPAPMPEWTVPEERS